MNKIAITVFLYIFIFLSCKGRDNVEINNKKEDTMQRKVLEKQLHQGAHVYNAEVGVEIPKSKFDQDELNAIAMVSNEILISNGYKNIGNNDFNEKIKEVFGRVIDNNSTIKYLYINYRDKCDKKIAYCSSNNIDVLGTYIAKENNFIFDFRYLPEVINYKKLYEDLAAVEDTLSEQRLQDGEQIVIEKWSALENNRDTNLNLSIRRKKITQTIISRNKYLFNDSKTDFIWLRANDQDFLNQLVKTFGYVKDSLLTRFVMNYNLSNKKEFGKIFWNLTCDNKLRFNDEVMALVRQSSLEDQHKYLDAIYSYIEFFVQQREGEYNLMFSQKAEVLGKLAYYAESLAFEIEYYPFRFFAQLNRMEEYQKEFEIKEYYSIPDFKKVWEDTKTGGIQLPM